MNTKREHDVLPCRPLTNGTGDILGDPWDGQLRNRPLAPMHTDPINYYTFLPLSAPWPLALGPWPLIDQDASA